VDSDPSNCSPRASNAVLSFELWIPIPRIVPLGPAAPSYHSGWGLRSLKFFLFGQQRRWLIRVMDSDFMSHLFMTYPCATRFAGPLVYYSRVFVIIYQVYASGHQRHYYDLLRASVPRFSLIRGQQRLSPNSGGSLNSSKSYRTLMLTLVCPNLVAIYQFGCRMSNTKISPQLATLDGPVIASNALC
jgi:hypothetical protein